MATNETSDPIAGVARELAALLASTPASFAVVDASSRGLLQRTLSEQAGAGPVDGIVASQTAMCCDLLIVPATDIGSGRTAGALASAGRRRFGRDIGIAISAAAAPTAGDGQGTACWVAVDVGDGPTAELLGVADDLEQTGRAAVVGALRLTARQLRAAQPARGTEPAGAPASHGDRRSGPDSSWRRNGLGLACLGLFVAFLIAQSLTGWRTAVADAVEHGGAAFGYWRYLTTGHFAEATFENWESEFLQMGAFVLLTIFLVQRGSGESKQEHDDPRDEDPRRHRADPDAPWPVRRGGVWLVLYEHSLLLAFTALFLGSLAGHAVAGAHEYTAEQHEHGATGLSPWQFATTSEFWFQSFQNWQSEFLAVGAIVVLSVFLRQRGSAESKPVHASHRRTGDD